MDEAIDFIRGFISAEHEGRLASYTEPDDEVRRQKAEKVMQYFDLSADIYLGFEWEQAPDEAFIADSKQTIERMRPRALFQIKKYKHPELGDLYRAYLGAPSNSTLTLYSQCTFVARQEDGLKIISVYAPCMTCHGSGRTSSGLCAECEGSGWEHAGGMQMESPGELVGVRKFEAPVEPISRADYDAE